MSTVTSDATLKDVVNQADPNKAWDAHRKMKLGSMLDPIEETVTVPTLAVLDFTAHPSADNRGAVMMVQSVEVLTGAAAAGSRIVVPSTDAASTTECVLAADGTTMTFEATVDTVRVRWLKASDTALSSDFPTSGVG